MDKNVNRMLCALDDEIDKKCAALRKKHTEKLLQRLFVLICLFLVAVPCTLVLAGITLLWLLVPGILFLILSVGALLPLTAGNSRGAEQ